MTGPQQVRIYTDGACLGNPGPGGYGVVLLYGDRRRELSAGFRRTTNNRMELRAAIEGVLALTRVCPVILFSDSTYVVKAMRDEWAVGWRARGWKKADRQPVANRDLWEWLLTISEPLSIEWRWVRGHAGDKENERCDQLANAAARGKDLQIDVGYEESLA